MEQYENRDFIAIETILAKGRKSSREPKIKNFYVNNKVSDLIEKEKDLELSKKLIECNFNINDAFNVIMSSNLTDDGSFYDKNKNKTANKNRTKNNNKNNKKAKNNEKDFANANQPDFMDFGVGSGKAKIQKRGTFIRKETRQSFLNLNSNVNKENINFRNYKEEIKLKNENQNEKINSPEDNMKKITNVSLQSNSNFNNNERNFNTGFFNTQRNFGRKETNFSHKNYLNFQNTNLKLKANLDLDRIKLKTSIEQKNKNNSNLNNKENKNSLVANINSIINEYSLSNINQEAKDLFKISSSNPNSYFYNNNNNNYNNNNYNNNSNKNNNDIVFSNLDKNNTLNLNNTLSSPTKKNFNKFLSNENQTQQQEQEYQNHQAPRLSIKDKNDYENYCYSRLIKTPNSNYLYNSFRRRKTEDEVALKYNKDLRTLKKYENLKENYFSNNNSIRKDSSVDEELENFCDKVKGKNHKIKINYSKTNKLNLNSNFNKTEGNFFAINANVNRNEAKKDTKNTNNLLSLGNNNNNDFINKETKTNSSLNNIDNNLFRSAELGMSKNQKENNHENSRNFHKNKVLFNSAADKNNNNNNNNNMKIVENNQEYSSFVNNNNNMKNNENSKDKFETIKSSKVKIDLKFEKKLKLEENLPSAFISRCLIRQGTIENLMKVEHNFKDNSQENKLKNFKEKKHNKDFLLVEHSNQNNKINNDKEINYFASASNKKRPNTNHFKTIIYAATTTNSNPNLLNNYTNYYKILEENQNNFNSKTSNKNNNKENKYPNDIINENNHKNNLIPINETEKEPSYKNKLEKLKSNSNLNKKSILLIDTENMEIFKLNKNNKNQTVKNNDGNNLFYESATSNLHWENKRQNLFTPQTQKSSSLTPNILLNSISKIESKTNKITKSLSKNIQKYKSIQSLSTTNKKNEISVANQEQIHLQLTSKKKPKTARPKIVMISSSVEEKRKNLFNLSENRQSLLKIADFIESMNDKIVLQFKSDIERQYKKSALKNGLVSLDEILDKKYQKILKNNDVLENMTVKTRQLENSILNTRAKIEEKYFSEEERKSLHKKNNLKVKKN